MNAQTSKKNRPAAATLVAKHRDPLVSPGVRARLDFAARAILALWAWAIAFRIRYHPIGIGHDSFAFMYNYARLRGWVFGRDLAFTYGPLAYLTMPMPVGSCLTEGILFQLSLWLAFAGVTGWFIFARKRPLAGVLLFALGLFLGCYAFYAFGYAGPDMLLVYFGLLLLGGALSERHATPWYAAACAIWILVFLVKFSSATSLGVALVLFAAARSINNRRWAVPAALCLAALPAAILAVYRISVGPPDALWRYIRSAMELSSSYGVVMSHGTDRPGLITAILIMIAWLPAAGILYWRRVNSWSLAFACLGPLCLEFKHSFAREGGHIEIFFVFVPLLAGLVALFTDIRRKDVWYLAAALALPMALWYPREALRVRFLLYPMAQLANLDTARQLLHYSDLRRGLGNTSAQVLASKHLPPELLARIGRATVAPFPMELSYVAANPIDERPLPLFQGYMAYTPYLDNWNAAFLEDAPRAPHFFLLDWEAIDERHPLLDVPATTLALYRHYDFDGTYGDHMLLRRRSAPRFTAWRLRETCGLRLDQPLRISPGDHPLIARIHLRWNPTGRLLKFLFRVPEVRLLASSTSGRVLSVHIPPEVMEDGVPLNFLPFDSDDARALFAGAPLPAPLEALSIAGPGARYLEPDVRVEIEEAPGLKLSFSAPPAPDFARLRHLGPLDSWQVDMMNDTGALGFSRLTVPDTRGYLRVQGWAVVNGDVAGGIWIELDGKLHPARYGLPRRDIGALFHRAGEFPCGFEWMAPVWDFGKAWHELSVRILARDGSGYYDGRRTLRFRME